MNKYIVLLLFSLNFIFQVGSDTYDGADRNLTTVPIDINSTVTVIDLSNNSITSLDPHSFRTYTSLIELYLNKNKLTTIDSSAFENTTLKILRLAFNELTEFPDLSVVSGTLETIVISCNPITIINASRLNLPKLKTLTMTYVPLSHWPDFSHIGENTTVLRLKLNRYPDNVTVITNVCHIGTLALNELRKPFIPRIQCPEDAELNTLILRKALITDTFDFDSLANFTSLKNLYLHTNDMTQIPKLPMALRDTLKILSLEDNPVRSIDPGSLEGYNNLNQLNLAKTKLTYVSAEVFQVSP